MAQLSHAPAAAPTNSLFNLGRATCATRTNSSHQSCAQACALLHNRSAQLSTMCTGLCVSNASRSACNRGATRWLTEDAGRGVHSVSDVGGGCIEAFSASHHAAQNLRTGGMRRAGAQADGEVLQHQVLLDRSRASRAPAQPGTPRVGASDPDVASTPIRFPGHGLRPRGATDRAVSVTRGRPLRHVPPHRLNAHIRSKSAVGWTA